MGFNVLRMQEQLEFVKCLNGIDAIFKENLRREVLLRFMHYIRITL